MDINVWGCPSSQWTYEYSHGWWNSSLAGQWHGKSSICDLEQSELSGLQKYKDMVGLAGVAGYKLIRNFHGAPIVPILAKRIWDEPHYVRCLMMMKSSIMQLMGWDHNLMAFSTHFMFEKRFHLQSWQANPTLSLSYVSSFSKCKCAMSDLS